MRSLIKQYLIEDGVVLTSKDLSKIINFKFDYYNFQLIIPIEDQMPSYLNSSIPFHRSTEFDDVITDKEIMLKYHNMKINGMFNGLSRIDGVPIFEVDLSQPDRNNKINIILDEKK